MNNTANILIKDPYLNTSAQTENWTRPHSTSVHCQQSQQSFPEPIIK